MFQGRFSSQGFEVVANDALSLITGTQAVSAGHVAATVRDVGSVVHRDLARVSSDLLASSAALRDANQAGFDAVRQSLAAGTASARTLGALSLATQAIGFSVVARALNGVGGEISALRGEAAAQAARLADLHERANAKLERLEEVAQRTLSTQQRILDTLVTSRTAEARQLIQQGWENLRHGYRDEAAARFEKSLEHDNTVYVAHAMLADFAREKGDTARARQHYGKAVAFAGQLDAVIRSHTHLQYARFLEEVDDFTSAVTQAQKAVDAVDGPRSRFFLAELLASRGDHARALEELERAVRSDPDLHAAALLSGPLRKIGVALTSRLVAMDEEVRSPLVDRLDAVGRRIAVLDRIAQETSGAYTGELLGTLRERYANALRLLADAKYAALQSAGKTVEELERSCERVCGITRERMQQPMKDAAQSLLRLQASTAQFPQDAPDALVDLERAVAQWREFDAAQRDGEGRYLDAQAQCASIEAKVRRDDDPPDFWTRSAAEEQAVAAHPPVWVPKWATSEFLQRERRRGAFGLIVLGSVVALFAIGFVVAAARVLLP